MMEGIWNDITTVVMDSFAVFIFDWWICDIVLRWYVNIRYISFKVQKYTQIENCKVSK
jgi:hypothetical protein